MNHAKIEKSNLFTKLLAHKADPDTSKEAAAKLVESGELSRQEKEVWDAIDWMTYRMTTSGVIRSHHISFTARELANSSSISYFKIQRRLSGLRAKGKIDRIQIGVKPDGKPIYKQRNGCCVWRIVGAKL